MSRPKKVCSIEGCGRPHLAKGWCKGHYERVKRSGEPGPADLAPYIGRACGCCRRNATEALTQDRCGVTGKERGRLCRACLKAAQLSDACDGPYPEGDLLVYLDQWEATWTESRRRAAKKVA